MTIIYGNNNTVTEKEFEEAMLDLIVSCHCVGAAALHCTVLHCATSFPDKQLACEATKAGKYQKV